MATLTITGVGITASSVFEKKVVGQAGDAGDALYLDIADNKWKPADANSTAIIAGRDGLAVQLTATEADGDVAILATGGEIQIKTAATFVEGATYVVSETAGGIAEDADLTSGSYRSVLGVSGTEGAATTDLSEFVLQPLASGKTVP